MKIGIIGSGEMGRTLGLLWLQCGHDILFGTRDFKRVADWLKSDGLGGKVGTYSDAVGFGDVVLLTTRWSETKGAIETAGSLKGKILIDCTNPEGKDGLVIGFTSSGAEEVAKWASGTKVVKAFNHIYGSMLRTSPQFGDHNASIFYCGDDNKAKRIVADLAKEIGLDPVDSGELKIARYIEPLSALCVNQASKMKWGGENIGLKFLHR
jgi:predicted dinucleotide-binding enzyme